MIPLNEKGNVVCEYYFHDKDDYTHSHITIMIVMMVCSIPDDDDDDETRLRIRKIDCVSEPTCCTDTFVGCQASRS